VFPPAALAVCISALLLLRPLSTGSPLRGPAPSFALVLQSVTSTIGRNIETVMAARLVHEGGRLTVLPMPENVDKVRAAPTSACTRMQRAA
jgi:hypothetical protein